MEVTSVPGVETTFCVRLPVSDGRAIDPAAPAPTARATTPSAGRERPRVAPRTVSPNRPPSSTPMPGPRHGILHGHWTHHGRPRWVYGHRLRQDHVSRRLPGISPTLSFEEALEATMVYSVAGLLGQRALVRARGRSGHPTTLSVAGLAVAGRWCGRAGPSPSSRAAHRQRPRLVPTGGRSPAARRAGGRACTRRDASRRLAYIGLRVGSAQGCNFPMRLARRNAISSACR